MIKVWARIAEDERGAGDDEKTPLMRCNEIASARRARAT